MDFGGRRRSAVLVLCFSALVIYLAYLGPLLVGSGEPVKDGTNYIFNPMTFNVQPIEYNSTQVLYPSEILHIDNKHMTANKSIHTNSNHLRTDNQPVNSTEKEPVYTNTNQVQHGPESGITATHRNSDLSHGDNAVVHTSNVQAKRVKYLYKMCGKLNTNKPVRRTTYANIMKTFAQLNLNYCKVPKVGCTFMSQMFSVIVNQTKDIFMPFNMSRNRVHGIKTTGVSELEQRFYTVPTILMARNPYSRVYSAYIDKIVLPSAFDDFLKIGVQLFGKEHSEKCQPRPSFKQFLHYIRVAIKTKRSVNGHWAPIYSICKPCLTNNIMVIKQESFSDDVKTLLNYLNVPYKTRDAIIRFMTVNRVSTTVPAIIKTTMKFSADRNVHKRCLGKLEVVELLWKSFQIQGYIRSNRSFPVKKLQDHNTITTDVIIDIVMAEIKSDELTSAERKSQRRSYLVEAYKDITQDIIEDINEFYGPDFLLYDYEMVRPK